MILFLVALAAGLSFTFGQFQALPEPLLIGWKGLGVGLLALWAVRQGQGVDHRLLAMLLALGAMADMVLELHFIGGALFFVLAHVVAIILYLRNRRWRRSPVAIVLALIWVVLIATLSAWLAGNDPAVGAYALFLGGMSAAAMGARFPLAAAGTLLFVLSDLLIFARLGGHLETGLVWPLYFGGQALIAYGVASRLH